LSGEPAVPLLALAGDQAARKDDGTDFGVYIPIIPIGYSRLFKYILPLTDYSNPNLTSSPIDPYKLGQFLITMSIDQQN
jgi:hypothetical protein